MLLPMLSAEYVCFISYHKMLCSFMVNSYYNLKWTNSYLLDAPASVYTVNVWQAMLVFRLLGVKGVEGAAKDIRWEFNMREFLELFILYNFRWLVSLCKLQGVQIVNILDQLLFLARTDTGGAQVVSGASFGNCWYSSSDTNYASKEEFWTFFLI